MNAEKPRRRVMVVEDNLDTVHTLVALLRADGHEVQYAINGYAAMALAPKFLPEIVILDLGLPGLNGFEVCTRLKKVRGFEATRFVAVSGYYTQADRARSRAVGCEAHLRKPADPNEILAIVGSDAPRS
jgi:two-component system CheB/CheR fusion protein